MMNKTGIATRPNCEYIAATLEDIGSMTLAEEYRDE